MNKLNPSFFMRRALKAETPEELLKAQTGLWNLFVNHTRFVMTQYRVGMTLLAEKLKK